MQSSTSTVTFYLANIYEHMLVLNEHYEWSQPFIVEMKSFDLANEFSEIFVRGIEVELLKMFRRISKELIVKLNHPRITNSSKVERFLIGDKTFVFHQDKLVCEGFEIVIEDRPVYEIFEQVTMIIGNLTFE